MSISPSPPSSRSSWETHSLRYLTGEKENRPASEPYTDTIPINELKRDGSGLTKTTQTPEATAPNRTRQAASELLQARWHGSSGGGGGSDASVAGNHRLAEVSSGTMAWRRKLCPSTPGPFLAAVRVGGPRSSPALWGDSFPEPEEQIRVRFQHHRKAATKTKAMATSRPLGKITVGMKQGVET
jgi:hypothetical protein